MPLITPSPWKNKNKILNEVAGDSQRAVGSEKRCPSKVKWSLGFNVEQLALNLRRCTSPPFVSTISKHHHDAWIYSCDSCVEPTSLLNLTQAGRSAQMLLCVIDNHASSEFFGFLGCVVIIFVFFVVSGTSVHFQFSESPRGWVAGGVVASTLSDYMHPSLYGSLAVASLLG